MKESDDDVNAEILRNQIEAADELWEGEQRRSKRLADKKKQAY